MDWQTDPSSVTVRFSAGEGSSGTAKTAQFVNSSAYFPAAIVQVPFTSANHAGAAYKPYLELTYTNNVAPQVNVRYPANNAVTPTLTPELLVRAKDPDNWPNKGLTYNFVVYDGTGSTVVANSGWTAQPAWRVPAGKLAWNSTYLYTVRIYDKAGYSAVYPAYAFTTSVPQPTLTANLAQNAGKGYDPGIGNYTTSATDAR